MPENTVYDYSSTCSALTEAIKDLELRIRMSEQNTKLKNTYSEKLNTLETNTALCNGTLEVLKEVQADVNEYIAKRRKSSMQNINNALRLAGEVIPDSADGIFFQIEDNGDAWLSTPNGLEVDEVEGGGYRQTSSVFIRSTILMANANLLQTMFLDEVFSLVSQENSATLSLYLNLLCQSMQIISIEQKPQVYSNIDHTYYLFEAGEYASVTKKDVKRGQSESEVGTDAGQVDGAV